jgi:hypothetical protein
MNAIGMLGQPGNLNVGPTREPRERLIAGFQGAGSDERGAQVAGRLSLLVAVEHVVADLQFAVEHRKDRLPGGTYLHPFQDGFRLGTVA